ncbi:MAG: excinuclease ABC subunit UvrC [Deltaproteobacteria bacterium]|nr:excinuclease ABC subunit UvrC [Deltaproteobacteria bacterium]
MSLEDKLKLLPHQPGVYKFLSKNNEIIYIGKSKKLNHRVRNYFNPSQKTDPRIENLLPHIADVEWIVTLNEIEAFILEDHLIKIHKPKYNSQLKDDKTYPYFKLTINELYPRLTLVREKERDYSLYFGPYVAVTQVRSAWRIIKKTFPLRQSKMILDGSKTYRPCLNYQLKRCFAPCAGLITPLEYKKIVDKVRQILKGNFDDLLQQLKKEMLEKSQALLFEDAAKIRDQIRALSAIIQKQRIVSKQKIDRDVFAVVRQGGFAGIQILFIRAGILLSDDFLFFRKAERFTDLELLRSAFSRLYISGGNPLPREILLPFEDEEFNIFEQYANREKPAKLRLLFPSRGEKKALLDLARKNGEQNILVKIQSSKDDELILNEVKSTLNLKNLPMRVECFDISNTSGISSVASMVVWENNKPFKKDYRRYKIRHVKGINDFLSMEEVMGRRYRPKEGKPAILPDLILIDGGKGQVSSALRALRELKLDLRKVDLLGLAKGKSEKRKEGFIQDFDFEYVVKPNRKNEIRLKKNSDCLHFLQKIRDEAHRFAIEYHRKLRTKNAFHSLLEDIPGIGPTKRKLLLKEFQTMDNIYKTDRDKLKMIKGLSKKDLDNIEQFIQAQKPVSD